MGGDPRKPSVTPKWVYCPVCFLLAKAGDEPPEKDKNGNAGPGWRLILVNRDEA